MNCCVGEDETLGGQILFRSEPAQSGSGEGKGGDLWQSGEGQVAQFCIEVVLRPYCYGDQQRAMEVTCACFNEVNARWRGGRQICISVASPGEF